LGSAFADIMELAASCRFRDCNHEREPGCAVRGAMEMGTLDAKRLKSWRSISAEMEREAKKAEFRLNHLQRNEGKEKRKEAMTREIDNY